MRKYEDGEVVKLSDILVEKPNDPRHEYLTTMPVCIETWTGDGQPDGNKRIIVEICLPVRTVVSHDNSLHEYILWLNAPLPGLPTGAITVDDEIAGFIKLSMNEPRLIIRNAQAGNTDWATDEA